VTSGSAVQPGVIKFDQPLESSGTQLKVGAPGWATASRFQVSVSLKDSFGNPVQTSSAGRFSLKYEGPGKASSIPANTDYEGLASFEVNLSDQESGSANVTATYDADGSGLASSIIVATKTIKIDALGEKFSSRTSLQKENQVKVYAKNVIGAGKVQIKLNGKEIAWSRADSTDSVEGASLLNAGRATYLVRTVDLAAGIKTVIEVFVDGERVTRSAYTGTKEPLTGFSSWTSLQKDNQVKVFAKNVIGAGKIQIKVNGKEIAWTRAASATSVEGASLLNAGGAYYLVRTVTLNLGVKSAIEVYVDGKRLTRSAYVGK
jgi:uncharacterized Zn-binding protein involved in type VI secretion